MRIDRRTFAGGFAATLATPFSSFAASITDATGRTVMPGNLSICAERGLAVFAFSVLDDDDDNLGDDDPFVMSGPLWSDPNDDDGRLRLVS
jgi:hypothetical protein